MESCREIDRIKKKYESIPKRWASGVLSSMRILALTLYFGVSSVESLVEAGRQGMAWEGLGYRQRGRIIDHGLREKSGDTVGGKFRGGRSLRRCA